MSNIMNSDHTLHNVVVIPTGFLIEIEQSQVVNIVGTIDRSTYRFLLMKKSIMML